MLTYSHTKVRSFSLPAVLVSLLLAVEAPVGRAQAPLVESFDMQVPWGPVAVDIAGQRHLVYELHLTNFTPDPLTLTRIDVLAPGRPAPLATFEGARLATLLGAPGATPAGADRLTSEPGTRTVAYFWLPLQGAAPATLTHRIDLDVVGSGKRTSAVVEGQTVTVGDQPAFALNPPLTGGLWTAVYDPVMERGHRRVFYTLDGRARIPGRFAIDWFKVDDTGKFATGDASRLENWYGYGAEVLAVADAVVASVRDGAADARLGQAAARDGRLESGAGNFVALDVGDGRFAFYEHLEPGSIRVKTGDRVRSGDVIAAVGNSGHTSGPHLHFHVSDANATLAAEGVPWALRQFVAVGAFPSISAVAQGQPFERFAAGSTRKQEMTLPAANAVVEFPVPAGR